LYFAVKWWTCDVIHFTKITVPRRFQLSAVRCRTMWTVNCTTTAASTQPKATTWDVTTATDNGSRANNRKVHCTYYCTGRKSGGSRESAEFTFPTAQAVLSDLNFATFMQLNTSSLGSPFYFLLAAKDVELNLACHFALCSQYSRMDAKASPIPRTGANIASILYSFKYTIWTKEKAEMKKKFTHR